MVEIRFLTKTALALTMGLTLSACVTTREREAEVDGETARMYLADKPQSLHDYFYVNLTQGERNRVLNNMRLGLAVYEQGDLDLAARLFDEALDYIESIYVDNPHAEKARSVFVKEAVKDFKGEPYERAMAYYYRGLIALRQGDFDNARASFKAGFLQDSFADEDQHQADFALLAYLQGWASKCRGNLTTAEQDFAEFLAIRPNQAIPAAHHNTLVLVETGEAPVKIAAADEHNAKPRHLKYYRAASDQTAKLWWDEKSARNKKTKRAEQDLPLLEDIYFQASTRGGRPFDSILAGKANFQDGAQVVSNVAAVGGLVAAQVAANSGNSDAAYLAVGLLAAALVAQAVANATEAEADTRYWDNLPDRIYGLTMELPAGLSALNVDILNADGSLDQTQTVQIQTMKGCNLAWVRGMSAQPATLRAPNSAPQDQMNAPVIIPIAPPPDAPVLSAPKDGTAKADDESSPKI